MSELDKLKDRLKALPKDFTYNEAKSLLNKLGFVEDNKGKTSGSRVKFFRAKDGVTIRCHKPHPKKEMHSNFLKDLLAELKKSGDIEE